MFDGSHRSQPRAVNLGTKRHKQQQGRGNSGKNSATSTTTLTNSIHTIATTTDDTKSALLERTRRLREDRRVAAERVAAAIRLQRHTRGHARRRHIRREWHQRLLQAVALLEQHHHHQQQQQHERTRSIATATTTTTASNDAIITALVNATLRLTRCGSRKLPLGDRDDEAVLSLLQQYAVWIHYYCSVQEQPQHQYHQSSSTRSLSPQIPTTTTTDTLHLSPPPPPPPKYILLATLRWIIRQNTASKKNEPKIHATAAASSSSLFESTPKTPSTAATASNINNAIDIATGATPPLPHHHQQQQQQSLQLTAPDAIAILSHTLRRLAHEPKQQSSSDPPPHKDWMRRSPVTSKELIPLLVEAYCSCTRNVNNVSSNVDASICVAPLAECLARAIRDCLPSNHHGRALMLALSMTHPTLEYDVSALHTTQPTLKSDGSGTTTIKIEFDTILSKSSNHDDDDEDFNNLQLLNLAIVLQQHQLQRKESQVQQMKSDGTSSMFSFNRVDPPKPTANPENGMATLDETTWNLVSKNRVCVLQRLVSSQQTTGKTVPEAEALQVAVRMKLLKILLLDVTDTSLSSSWLIWLLMCLVRRGGTLEDVGKDTSINTSIDLEMEAEEKTELDTESEDDDDEDDHVRNTSKLTASRNARMAFSNRMTKHELQTLPKLDRLILTHVLKADQRFGNVKKPTLFTHILSVASSITDPRLWVEWGNLLFATAPSGDSLSDESTLASVVYESKRDYVHVLAILLQGTTGLRPRQHALSSKLLIELASSKRLLENLWQYILFEMDSAADNATKASESRTILMLACSVFSDLFAHRLIALRDDQFLLDHTTRRSITSGITIIASDVITRMRTLLHGLYWTHPVKASDFNLMIGADGNTGFSDLAVVAPNSSVDLRFAASRARLLLSGTKLWNSLYERWCRLVRHDAFCDEFAWCFPDISSVLVDNAVLTGQSQSVDNIDEDDMVIDDSSVESAMDLASDALAESDQLADAFSHPKMARLLTSIPQAMPFGNRVKLFDSLLRLDKRNTQDETAEMHEAVLGMMRGQSGRSHDRNVKIRRDEMYNDSMVHLNSMGAKLKRRIQVTFINQHGAQEAGIDGGGVFKEFIHDLIKDAFLVVPATLRKRLFTSTTLQTLAVNSDLVTDTETLQHYEFLGRVLGKAVYESILVEPQFCLPFLNQLLGKSNSLEDLKNFDPEYHRNLTKLLSLDATELDDLGLTFELTLGSVSSSSAAATRTVELIPHGRDKAVTKMNVIQYIHLISHYRLNVLSARQTRAFLAGFRDLIPASWVRLFSGYELQKVISGDDSVLGIDVEDLKRSMQYSAGYHVDQPIIQWFWEIVENDLTVEQQHQLLRFMTSCSRQPLLGFGSLAPAPCIQQIRLPDALFEPHLQHHDKTVAIHEHESFLRKQTPLPTSSTCMNLLKLPNYRSKDLMRFKLIVAIESGAGFELS